MAVSDFVFYVFSLAALVITLLQLYRLKREWPRYAIAVILCILYALIILFSSGIPIVEMLFLLSIEVIAANMIYSYASLKFDFLVDLVITLAAFAYWSSNFIIVLPFIEAFAVGSFVALILKFGYVQRIDKHDKGLEKRRDILQIIMGAIILVAFLFAKSYSYTIVFLLVLLGYTVSSHFLEHRATRFLKSLERKGSVFGAGAMYMAVGTMLILGSITNYNYVVVGLIALLICDAAATIVGTHGKYKLPYNKEKTIEGTIAYFVLLAVLGFYFISYYAILFGAVLALLESAINSVDDNISIPIAVIVLTHII